MQRRGAGVCLWAQCLQVRKIEVRQRIPSLNTVVCRSPSGDKTRTKERKEEEKRKAAGECEWENRWVSKRYYIGGISVCFAADERWGRGVRRENAAGEHDHGHGYGYGYGYGQTLA